MKQSHLLSVQESSNSGDRNRWSVHSGRDQSTEHSLAEARVGSSGQESEQSDQQVVVQIGASGLSLVGFLNSASFHEINTLHESGQSPSLRSLVAKPTISLCVYLY